MLRRWHLSRYLKGYFACRNTCKGPEAGTCLGALRRVSRSMCPEHHDGGGGIQRDGWAKSYCDLTKDFRIEVWWEAIGSFWTWELHHLKDYSSRYVEKRLEGDRSGSSKFRGRLSLLRNTGVTNSVFSCFWFFTVNCLKVDLDLFIFYCQYPANAWHLVDV